MKILVTGADGMLGSYLARELLARKHVVRALIQPGSDSPTLDGLAIERSTGDLLNEQDMHRAAADCEGVIHCAAITNLRADPDFVWRVNFEGTRHVADACLAHKVKRLVYVGSASSFAFGSKQSPAKDCGEFPQAYRGVAYMESKRRATDTVRDYVQNRGLNAIIVAPTFLIGGHNFRPGSSDLLRGFAQGRLRVLPHGGRNFVFAGDVACALANALDQGEPGGCYLAAGENLTYGEFFARAAQIVKRPSPKTAVPNVLVKAVGLGGSLWEFLTGRQVQINYLLTRLSVLSTYYSSERAVKELSMPQTSIEQAIEESVKGLYKYGLLP